MRELAVHGSTLLGSSTMARMLRRRYATQAVALSPRSAIEATPIRSRLYSACESVFGEVGVLVNNHTYCVMETFDPDRLSSDGIPVRLPTPASIDAHFRVNARAYARSMAEYVARYGKRGWSRIINISTDAAHAHVANISYAASKHAIEYYTRSAAAELGGYGITVNAVAPGPVQTGYIEPDLEAQIVEGTPLGRVGYPEDIADSVVFLASE